mgnify:CR=1 FL=1
MIDYGITGDRVLWIVTLLNMDYVPDEKAEERG